MTRLITLARSVRRWLTPDALVALLALLGIAVHLVLRDLVAASHEMASAPLLAVLLIGGSPLVLRLVWRSLRGKFGSDHLAAISIVACRVSIARRLFGILGRGTGSPACCSCLAIGMSR
jgi:hypothetical protein